MTAYPAVIASWVQEVVRRQHEALETACWAALRDGCEVHVYPSPGFSTAVGIELRPGPVRTVWHSPWEVYV
jgi:hypothetical protein